jgi:hypothetical protein
MKRLALLAAGIVALGLAGAYVFRGAPGILGFALGLASATFGCATLWAFAGLIGSSAKGGSPPKFGALLAVLGFLLKVPLYLGCFRLSQRLGTGADTCFILGVVVVYFGLVVGSLRS